MAKPTEELLPSVLIFLTCCVFHAELNVLTLSEKKRNAPYTGKSNKGVDNSADQRILTAENPGNYVKLKKTDTAPVERTDDRENERDSIKHHIKLPFVKKWDGSTALIVSHGEKFYANTEKRD